MGPFQASFFIFFARRGHQRTFRFPELIPEGKVQTEIIFELFVMIRMMCSADKPFAKAMLPEPVRVDFNVKMVDDAAKCHNRQL